MSLVLETKIHACRVHTLCGWLAWGSPFLGFVLVDLEVKLKARLKRPVKIDVMACFGVVCSGLRAASRARVSGAASVSVLELATREFLAPHAARTTARLRPALSSQLHTAARHSGAGPRSVVATTPWQQQHASRAMAGFSRLSVTVSARQLARFGPNAIHPATHTHTRLLSLGVSAASIH
jgi:hypothetical protein